MALLPNKANSEENNDKMDSISCLPAGDYLAVIKKAEFKQTKAKTGHYLNCTFVVAEGPKRGSVFFVLLNLDNPNPVAVDIANKELNTICEAMGLHDVEDSDELLGIEIGVTLKVKPGDSNYPPSNEVTAYFPAEEYEEEMEDGPEIETEVEVEQPKQEQITGGTPVTSNKPETTNDSVPEETKSQSSSDKLPWD